MKLELDPAAKAELREARDLYEAQRKGLGRDFVREMREVANRAAEKPLRFPIVEGTSSRHALGKRFPYLIIFAVEKDVVRILSVAHQHRDPDHYLGRS